MHKVRRYPPCLRTRVRYFYCMCASIIQVISQPLQQRRVRETPSPRAFKGHVVMYRIMVD